MPPLRAMKTFGSPPQGRACSPPCAAAGVPSCFSTAGSRPACRAAFAAMASAGTRTLREGPDEFLTDVHAV
jgi:hypothetical protein